MQWLHLFRRCLTACLVVGAALRTAFAHLGGIGFSSAQFSFAMAPRTRQRTRASRSLKVAENC